MKDFLKAICLRKRVLLGLTLAFVALAVVFFVFRVVGLCFSLDIDAKPGKPTSASFGHFYAGGGLITQGQFAIFYTFGNGQPESKRVRWSNYEWTFGAVDGLNQVNWAGVPMRTITLISYWPLIFLFLIISSVLIKRYLRAIPPEGHCTTCNYDLRAHHPGQKCPECGTPIPTPDRPPPKS
jgi:hypothetical protein